MTKPIEKILLAHAFFLKNDPKQLVEKFKPYPPLAALYAASSLDAQQLKVSLFDATLSEGVCEFSDHLTQFDPHLLLICEDSFNFLSKMCLSHVRQATIEMIAIAKTRNIPVVVNSSDAADAPHTYLDAGADFVIIGEVETTLLELVEWLNGKQCPEQQSPPLPAGLIYNLDGQWGRSVRRKPRRDIDTLAQPMWSLVDIEKYRQAWQQYHGFYGINMVTTRGCPYRCNWCAKPIWGQQYVSHSPAYIVEQLQLVNQLARPQHIWFADDIFGLKRGWIEQFAAQLQAAQLHIPFMIQTRADLMTPSTVDALKNAGCEQVWLGVESGSQQILDAMEKDLCLSQVSEATTLLKAANISIGFFIQLGYLNEDIRQIEQTRELILSHMPNEIGVSVSYPLPGTGFYDTVKAKMPEKTHWQDSNDLDVVFNATFTTEFYRRIRNHLHQELNSLHSNPECQNTKRHWQNQWQQLINSAESHRNQVDIKFAGA